MEGRVKNDPDPGIVRREPQDTQEGPKTERGEFGRTLPLWRAASPGLMSEDSEELLRSRRGRGIRQCAASADERVGKKCREG
jgi:hypothetical protein